MNQVAKNKLTVYDYVCINTVCQYTKVLSQPVGRPAGLMPQNEK